MLAITMGDPTGVGPELVVRGLAHLKNAVGRAVVFATRAFLNGGPPYRQRPARLGGTAGVTLLDRSPAPASAESGRRRWPISKPLLKLPRRGEVTALVTAPIHKASCMAAGFAFPGHHGVPGRASRAKRPVMMLAGPHLRVVPATTHVALSPAALANRRTHRRNGGDHLDRAQPRFRPGPAAGPRRFSILMAARMDISATRRSGSSARRCAWPKSDCGENGLRTGRPLVSRRGLSQAPGRRSARGATIASWPCITIRDSSRSSFSISTRRQRDPGLADHPHLTRSWGGARTSPGPGGCAARASRPRSTWRSASTRTQDASRNPGARARRQDMGGRSR